jgi:ribulose-5-phosphate 4-epimerase/fuculose-1-phosphate aldolase
VTIRSGGEIDSPLLGAELFEAIGDATCAMLVNHGVVIAGATIEEATYRAAAIDRVCRMAYDVMLLGKDPLRMPAGAVKGMKQALLERAVDVYWAGAVRQLLKAEPEVSA